MKKTTSLLVLISLLLVAALTACGGSSDEAEKSAAGDVVQSAADAFETGFNNRDLSEFDTFFAPASDQFDTSETLAAAHQLMDGAASGVTFQMDKLDIQDVQLDQKRVEAVVTYYAEVSMWENSAETYTAVVTQNVSLQKIDHNWLITGSDPADVTPGQSSG